jgi:chromate transporter
MLFVLPGFTVIAALSTFYVLYNETAWLVSLLFGLKAAVLAIVIEAVIRIGRRALADRVLVTFAAAAFVGIFALHIPFPAIVLGAGAVGFIASALGWFEKGTAGDGEKDTGWMHKGHAPGLGGSIRVAAIWGTLWAAPIAAVAAVFGWDSIYAALAVFFSKMAVVTFGGAYAVLAYVADAAVSNYGWLSPSQMLDGLAMAETTPGPLILVLAFVGFFAAHGDPAGLPPLLAGLLGAALTAWVTFVPCFLWIFLGAPYVERLSSNRALAAALRAITAAVVGVILNLAVFLGLHFLFGTVGDLTIGPIHLAWPSWTTLNGVGLALSVLAVASLFWFRLGVLPTLALSCGLGVALSLLSTV